MTFFDDYAALPLLLPLFGRFRPKENAIVRRQTRLFEDKRVRSRYKRDWSRDKRDWSRDKRVWSRDKRDWSRGKRVCSPSNAIGRGTNAIVPSLNRGSDVAEGESRVGRSKDPRLLAREGPG